MACWPHFKSWLSGRNSLALQLQRQVFRLRDSWQILDVDDNPIAQLQEDSTAMAMVRRFLSNLIPQRFHIACEGGGSVEVRQHFNPFVYRLQVSIPRQVTLDRRLIMGVVSLIAAIEGRQN